MAATIEAGQMPAPRGGSPNWARPRDRRAPRHSADADCRRRACPHDRDWGLRRRRERRHRGGRSGGRPGLLFSAV